MKIGYKIVKVENDYSGPAPRQKLVSASVNTGNIYRTNPSINYCIEYKVGEITNAPDFARPLFIFDTMQHALEFQFGRRQDGYKIFKVVYEESPIRPRIASDVGWIYNLIRGEEVAVRQPPTGTVFAKSLVLIEEV